MSTTTSIYVYTEELVNFLQANILLPSLHVPTLIIATGAHQKNNNKQKHKL